MTSLYGIHYLQHFLQPLGLVHLCGIFLCIHLRKLSHFRAQKNLPPPNNGSFSKTNKKNKSHALSVYLKLRVSKQEDSNMR